MRKKLLAVILVAVMVLAFAAPVFAAPAPVPGNPAWKASYSTSSEKGIVEGKLWNRGNASGDKITSNAHSADWEGVYFYWDDKQKEPGVLLVCDWVFDLFEAPYTHAGSGIKFDVCDPGFVLTAKNSNNYWGYKIARSTGKVIDTVDGVKIWAFAIPKQNQDTAVGNNGKVQTVKEDLKNINMVFIDGQYKSAWILISKAWFDEEGKLIWNFFDNCELNKSLAFSNGYKLGLNEKDFNNEIKITDFATAAKGKTVTITETKVPAGFKFHAAGVNYGNGKVAGEGVSLTLKPGDFASVWFANKKQWAEIEIRKIWLDSEGNECDAPGDALFDIEKNTGYNDVKVGTYKVKEGYYEVFEQEIEGYDLVDIDVVGAAGDYALYRDFDDRVIGFGVKAGQKAVATFTNQDPGGDFSITNFRFEKKVDEANIVEWLIDCKWLEEISDPLELMEAINSILAGLEFYLEGPNGSYGPVTPDSMSGIVAFNDIEPGVYILSEEVTGAAVGKFEKIADIEVEIFEGDNKFIILSGASSEWGLIGGDDFDYGAVYAGFFSPQPEDNGGAYFNLSDEAKAIAGDTMDFLKNNNGNGFDFLNDYFSNFHVSNKTETSKLFETEYSSFCADWFSGGLVHSPFYVDKSDVRFAGEKGAAVKADIIKAFNYIISEYGDLDWRTNKLIANYVLWLLLDDGVVAIEANNSPDISAAIADVLANYSSFDGTAVITDVVFLAAEDYVFPHDYYLGHQPQLVAISGGELYVNNNPTDIHYSFSFEKRVEGVSIVEWLVDCKWFDEISDPYELKDAIESILAGLEFCLDGPNGSYGPVTPDVMTGMVLFEDIEPGVYTLSEEVTGAAVGKFKKIADIEVEIFEGDNKFIILSGASSEWGFGGGASFAADDKFTIGAYFGPMFWLYSTAPVTQGGQIFGIRAYLGDDSWSSFCAHAGSTAFANNATCDGYYVNGSLAADKKAKLISAFNYIESKYGSVAYGETADAPQLGGGLGVNGYENCYFDPMWFEGEYATDPNNDYATRIFSQIIVWNIMDGIDIELLLTDILPDAYKEVIRDIFENAVLKVFTGGEYDDIVYLVCANEGLEHEVSCQPQVFPVKGGDFYINNEPTKPHCSLHLEKKVEGINIIEWLVDSNWADDAEDILAGLEFYLTGVDNSNAYGPVTPDSFGIVAFDDIEPGEYVLSEEVTGAAAGKFQAMDDITVVIADGDNKFFTIGGVIKGGVEGVDIIDGDKFIVHDGYGDFRWGYDGNGIGYPVEGVLNASGHIFYITVENIRTGDILESYCAYGGSTSFGPGPYLVGHSITEKDWIMAFNYIFDNYGDLNDNRVITQVITWALLGVVDVYILDQSRLKDHEIAAIIDVWENYDGYVGEGNVVDVLFLVDENTPLNEDGSFKFSAHQPQIVPIFGKFYVKNEVAGFHSSVSFMKVKYGGKFPVGDCEFSFDLFRIVDDEEVYVGTYYTNVFGTVTVPDDGTLTPGDYVFREILTVDLDDISGWIGFDASYRFVWKVIYPGGADGLYFSIDENGKETWEEEFEEGYDMPIVNNEYYCKHAFLWTATKETEDSIPYGDGWIRFDEEHRSSYGISYLEADCNVGARWFFWCDICSPINGGFNVNDEKNPATGHDIFYEPVHPMWCVDKEGNPVVLTGPIYRRCRHDNCGYSEQIFDYAQWYALCEEAGWSLAGFPEP